MAGTTPTPPSIVPFVRFGMSPTSNVGSTITTIFNDGAKTCLIDSILIANKTSSAINVKLSIVRTSAPASPKSYIFSSVTNISANSRLDVLNGQFLVLQATDSLTALTDYSQGIFDSFVSYRQLTES